MSWYIIHSVQNMLRKVIPAGAETNSVHEILLTQLQPRLPTSGTIAKTADLISAGTIDFNATAKASINTEVDGALNTIVPASPTAGSLNDILSKATGGNTFSKATDSLEMLSDKLGGYAGTGGAGATESVKAELDLVKAKTDTIAATPVSAASATTAGTIVQDSAMGTGTPDVVTVATDATANTFGSWVQLDASAAANVWICAITVGTQRTNSNTCVEIGTGGAGAETAKIRLSISRAGADSLSATVFMLPIPIKVASGVRIAARASSSYGSGAVDMYVSISYYTGLET